MKQNAKCYEAENGQKDTAGMPIKVRVCYCGTTACENLGNDFYKLPKDFFAPLTNNNSNTDLYA